MNKNAFSFPLRPLRDVLVELNRTQRDTNHPLGRYVAAFKDSPWLVLSVVAIGGNSIVFKLEDGNILHVTNKVLTSELGTRFFDLPMIKRCALQSPGAQQVHYFVQPEAETPVSECAMRDFQRQLEPHGWMLSDRSQHQLGVFQGETKLLDPFAVERIPLFRTSLVSLAGACAPGCSVRWFGVPPTPAAIFPKIARRRSPSPPKLLWPLPDGRQLGHNLPAAAAPRQSGDGRQQHVHRSPKQKNRGPRLSQNAQRFAQRAVDRLSISQRRQCVAV